MSMRRIASLLALLSLAAALAAQAAPPRDVADEDVDFAIEQAKRFLYDQQQADGHWSAWKSGAGVGGTTGLALFALLEAGESAQDPRIRKGLDALVAIKPEGSEKELYTRAVRVMALSAAVAAWKDSPYRAPLEAEVAWLSKGALTQGAWGYHGPERTGDNSCSQFALLALWEADRAGVKLNNGLLEVAQRTWLARQQKDGGWTYQNLPNITSSSTLSMTAAGLASLYVCQDVLMTACGPNRNQKALDAGWEYLAQGLKDDYINNEYLAFCIQRAGMASGMKFMGGKDWYAMGAARLAAPTPQGRQYGGQWQPIVRAAFELIFLARGRTPVVINKLQHGQPNWDFHTRDLSHFAEYMRRTFERRMRWQIVRLADDVTLLLDAPMLLVTGGETLDLPAEDWDKLREYTLRGGLLLLVPVHGSKAFAESARKGLEGLYAAQREQAGGHYSLEMLPAEHPVYQVHQKIAGGGKSLPIWGVSDGTRVLAMLLDRDIAHAWQQGLPSSGVSVDHMLGVNLFLYATGANQMSTRLRPVFAARPAGGKIKHTARVAWLKHGGNWNTQPYALQYLSQKLQAENGVKIELSAGAAAESEQLKGQNLAWLTGSSAFALSEAEVAALRQYLAEGGMLFVNAVGGSEAFDRSARALLDQLLPPERATAARVGEDSPLMTGKIMDQTVDFRGPPVGQPQRTMALRRVARAGSPLEAFSDVGTGRIAALYARYGIHDTLDGHTVDGALSFMPASARDIAANVVLYSLLARPAAATQSAPAGSPASEPATRP